MENDIRILILEDVREDSELVQRELIRKGLRFQCRVVETGDAFEEALRSFVPDIILSDYSLPTYNGLKALECARSIAPQTPFIMVTGSINEKAQCNA